MWFQRLNHSLLIINYFFSWIFLTSCTHVSCHTYAVTSFMEKRKSLPWSHSSLQLPPNFSSLIYSRAPQKSLYLSSLLLLFCSSQTLEPSPPPAYTRTHESSAYLVVSTLPSPVVHSESDPSPLISRVCQH